MKTKEKKGFLVTRVIFVLMLILILGGCPGVNKPYVYDIYTDLPNLWYFHDPTDSGIHYLYIISLRPENLFDIEIKYYDETSTSPDWVDMYDPGTFVTLTSSDVDSNGSLYYVSMITSGSTNSTSYETLEFIDASHIKLIIYTDDTYETIYSDGPNVFFWTTDITGFPPY